MFSINEKKIEIFSIFLVFLFAFLASFVIQFSTDKIAGYDPFYHIAQANAYWTGEKIDLPVFSSMSNETKVQDLYYMYHMLIAPFTSQFTGENYESLVIGAKLFQCLLFALFFTVFFIIIKNLLRYSIPSIKQRDLLLFSSLSLIILFMISDAFVFRLALIRPHTISIIFFLLSFYFIFKRRFIPLFFISLMLPFFYSVSFVILIPPIIYLFAKIIYERAGIFKFDFYKPFLYSLSGLIAGILMLPNTLFYLFNAYYVHLLAIFNKIHPITVEGAELNYPTMSQKDIFFLVPLCFILVHYFVKLKVSEKRIKDILNFNDFFLLTLSTAMLVLYMLFSRAAEYFIPIVAILILLFFYKFFMPAVKEKVASKRLFLQEYENNKFVVFINDVFKEAIENKKIAIVFKSSIVFIVSTGFFVNMILSPIKISETTYPFNSYFASAKYLEKNSQKNDIVFQTAFHEYAPLIFFNKKDHYIMGMGSVFTYVKYPEKYWLWYHSVFTDNICDKKECDHSNYSLYDVVKNEFNAKFVFLNNAGDGYKTFKEKLEKDSRFNMVFQDPKYKWISVYEVK